MPYSNLLTFIHLQNYILIIKMCNVLILNA